MAGVITNPVDIVYTRQVADALYPKGCQRNYSTFLDGLHKVHAEGALFRGALPNGIAIGMLHASMSSVYDWLKEYCYWFAGPTDWLRAVCLAPTALLGLALFMPFDNMKTRYHTMTPLPNGELPYRFLPIDMFRIGAYEGNKKKYSGANLWFSGGLPAFLKLFTSLYLVFNFYLKIRV